MSKIKLIPVPSITKREINKAVMDGRKFCINSEGVRHLEIHWDENHGHNPVRQGLERWNWRGFKYLCELVEQHWYEDPDMVGKPVKVKNECSNLWTLDFFIGASAEWEKEWRCNGGYYDRCEPLTAADLYQEQV